VCITQEAEEAREDFLTRLWRKYVKLGEAIDELAHSDVRVLVAATQAGQFGSVTYPKVYFYLQKCATMRLSVCMVLPPQYMYIHCVPKKHPRHFRL